MTLHASPEHTNFREQILLDYANELYQAMFAKDAPYGTTHDLVRDYARRTVELALHNKSALLNKREVKRLKPPYKEGGIRKLGKAKDRNEDNYRNGNAPLQMHFMNYTLGKLVPDRSNYDSKNTGYKNIVANTYRRIYNLGYSLEVFGDIDEMIARYSPLSRSADNENRVDCYGKKYFWIAYYELYRLHQDKGLELCCRVSIVRPGHAPLRNHRNRKR